MENAMEKLCKGPVRLSALKLYCMSVDKYYQQTLYQYSLHGNGDAVLMLFMLDNGNVLIKAHFNGRWNEGIRYKTVLTTEGIVEWLSHMRHPDASALLRKHKIDSLLAA